MDHFTHPIMIQHALDDSDDSFLQVASFSTSLKDIILSSRESGFNMNRLSLALENGFQT